MPEEMAWATMVFLPKGRCAYRGIGPKKVVWKVCATVANCCLKRSVTLHNKLYGFNAGRGTGTSTLEANLVQQLAGPCTSRCSRFSYTCVRRMIPRIGVGAWRFCGGTKWDRTWRT